MALPLPRVIPDVGPGGGLVTALGGINALRNNLYNANYNKAKSEYAPYSLRADAASKLAYAQMLGPQYLAKVFNNPDFLAGLTEEQRGALPNLLLKAGIGAGNTGASASSNSLNQIPGQTQQGGQSNNSFLDYLKQGLQSALGNFGLGNKNQSNALNNVPSPQGMRQPDIAGIPNEPSLNPGNEPTPGQAVNQQTQDPEYDEAYSQWQQTKQAQNAFKQGDNAPIPDPEQIKEWYRDAQDSWDEWRQSPEGERELEKGKYAKVPTYEEAIEWRRKRDEVNGHKPTELTLTEGQRPKTLAEKSAEFQGIKEEGKEAGKIRAKASNDLDLQYQAALQAEKPLENIIKMTTDPVFQSVFSGIPYLQGKTLDFLSQTGNPEQQKIIGTFINNAKSVVAETVKGFRGRILDSEVQMSKDMKIGDNDTWYTMLGKVGAAAELNQITQQRSKIASRIMRDEHVSLGEALERADSQVNGEAIREKIDSQLGEPIKPEDKPTDEDIKFMAKKRGISIAEVKKRLKAKGY